MQVNYHRAVDLPCNFGQMWMGVVNNNPNLQLIVISWRLQERIRQVLGMKPHSIFKNEDNQHFPVYFSWYAGEAYHKIINNLSLLIYDVNITVAACQETQ